MMAFSVGSGNRHSERSEESPGEAAAPTRVVPWQPTTGGANRGASLRILHFVWKDGAPGVPGLAYTGIQQCGVSWTLPVES